jgi:hypothetical protein
MHDGPTLQVEIDLTEPFNPARLSQAELEHLAAFLGEVLREMALQSDGDEDRE